MENNDLNTSAMALKTSFLHDADGIDSVIELFNLLTDVYFFVKDAQGRFIAANTLELEKLGQAKEQDVIGKTDYDFFPEPMVLKYLKDDKIVMESGQPMRKKVEQVTNPDGSISLHITSKVPVKSKQGKVIGIMGFMRDIDKSTNHWRSYQQMKPVIDYIDKHYRKHIVVEDLAKQVNLSVSQFEKRFRVIFNATPTQFLIRYRITQACHDLIYTNHKIIEISVANGFYDHSHFSREFKRIMGLSPGSYRKRYR